MKLDYHNGISFGAIKNHVRILRLKGWPEIPLEDFEIEKIFYDIDNFLTDVPSV